MFPTRPGGKEPRDRLSWPAAATADVDRLSRAAFRPGENYGIAAKLSGLVILDLDQPKPGYQLPPKWEHWRNEPGIVNGCDVLAALAEHAGVTSWPCTFTVTTPSGGAHLYYRAPDGRKIGNSPLGPMIDVRGGGDSHGGYVLGPGSVRDGRPYRVADGQDPRPLPGWIADLLDPPAGTGRRSETPALPEMESSRTYNRLRALVQTVLDSTPGDRNGPLFWSACRAGEMVAAGEIERDVAERVLRDAALAAGLRGGEREALRTISSGLNRRAVA